MKYLKNQNPSDISEGLQLFEELRFVSVRTEMDTDHNLLSANKQLLANLHQIDSIVLVGISASGKSTAINTIRDLIKKPEYRDHFSVPQRIVTRRQRLNDNLIENYFSSDRLEFLCLTEGGVRWQRVLNKRSGRVEHYGFGPVPASKIPIYSANNAFVESGSNLSGMPTDLFQSSLVVRFWCHSWIQQELLVNRSPDIMKDEGEASTRLGGESKYNLENLSHFIFRIRSVEKERPLSELFARVLLSAVFNLKQERLARETP